MISMPSIDTWINQRTSYRKLAIIWSRSRRWWCSDRKMSTTPAHKNDTFRYLKCRHDDSGQKIYRCNSISESIRLSRYWFRCNGKIIFEFFAKLAYWNNLTNCRISRTVSLAVNVEQRYSISCLSKSTFKAIGMLFESASSRYYRSVWWFAFLQIWMAQHWHLYLNSVSSYSATCRSIILFVRSSKKERFQNATHIYSNEDDNHRNNEYVLGVLRTSW